MLGISNPKTFDWANIPLEECLKGNAMDAFFTLKLYEKFSVEISKMKSEVLLDKVISPALSIFSDIEYEGMEVSPQELSKLDKKLYFKCIELEDALYNYDEVPKGTNLRSNKDLVGIFYLSDNGFNLYPPDNTPTGAPSVSAPTLELLASLVSTELAGRKSGKLEK